MAVRVNASGEYLRRTANLPSSTAFTMCGWAKMTRRTSQYQYWGLENATSSSTSYLLIGYPNSGAFEISSSASNGAFASSPTDEKWFFWAISNQGTGASDFKGYWRHYDDTSWKTATAQGVSFTAALMQLGNDSYDEYCNIAFDNTMVFSTALTQAQLEVVMSEWFPQLTDNLVLWSPHYPGATERLADWINATARNWTAGGTLSDEDGAPLTWAGFIYMPVFATGGPWTVAVNQVTETDLAQPVTFTGHKYIAVGQVTETDTAQAITRSVALFTASHENGDLSEYNGSVTGGDNITVTSGAALNGSAYGMQVMIDDAIPHYAYYTFGTARSLTVFEYRTYIKRSTLSLNDLGQVSHVFFINSSGTGVFGSLKIINISGTYYLRCVLVDDTNTHRETATYTMNSGIDYCLEVRYTKATNSTSNDAKLEWWVNGSAQTTISGYDLYDNMTLLTIAVGAVGQSGTVSGIFDLDEIVANDTGAYIGLADPTKKRTVQQVTETDLAQPVSHLKAKAIGQVTETDAAQAITHRKTKTLVQVTETDTAQVITHRKTKTLAQVTETDTAQPITRKPNNLSATVNQVTETDLAQPVSHLKAKAIAQVIETDAAQAITHRKTKTLVQVTETDTAQAITHRKTKTLAQVIETDTAQPVTKVGNKVVLVVQISETDLAQPISRSKVRSVAQVSETDLAQPMVRVRLRVVQTVSETDIAQALFGSKRVAVAQVVEIDLAQALTRAGYVATVPGIATLVDSIVDLAVPGVSLFDTATTVIAGMGEISLSQSVPWAAELIDYAYQRATVEDDPK